VGQNNLNGEAVKDDSSGILFSHAPSCPRIILKASVLEFNLFLSKFRFYKPFLNRNPEIFLAFLTQKLMVDLIYKEFPLQAIRTE